MWRDYCPKDSKDCKNDCEQCHYGLNDKKKDPESIVCQCGHLVPSTE